MMNAPPLGRRLRALSGQLAPIATSRAPCAGVDDAAVDEAVERHCLQVAAIGAPFACVAGTAAVLPEELASLGEKEAVAAASRDYRLATALADTASVLAPMQPRLAVNDCAPKTLAEQHAFYLQHGFCVVHGVVPVGSLPRAQAAWLTCEASARTSWEEGRAAAETKSESEKISIENKKTQVLAQYRTFFDVENLVDADDSFIDIIDSPAVLPLLSLICGSGGESLDYDATYGQVRYGGQGGRVVPPDINPEGYCGWHRDFPPPDAWPRPKGRLVKAFTTLWDVPLNGGEGGLVPGSHRLLLSPGEALAVHFKDGGNIGRSNFGPDDPAQCEMPNCVRFTLPAGSCVMFDTATWHTSLPNLIEDEGKGGGIGGRSRCTVQTNYQSSSYNWGTVEGRQQSWRNLDSDSMISKETLRRLDAEGKLGIQRRRILGLPDEGPVPDLLP